MGLDTKFVFLGWPKAKIWAIQFSADFDGGHFEKCPKRWGRPNLYGVNISIIDQWGPLNKMIPLIEDPGGGARWPLWAHGLYLLYDADSEVHVDFGADEGKIVNGW